MLLQKSDRRVHLSPLSKGDYRGCATNQRRLPAARDATKLSQSFDSREKSKNSSVAASKEERNALKHSLYRLLMPKLFDSSR